MKGKRKSKPTDYKRKSRQDLKVEYTHIREDAQLAGIIPTTPEEAVRPERVNSSSQGESPQIGLIVEALTSGWSVPEHKKPKIVNELLKIVEDVNIPVKTRVAAFNALRMADQTQYERDHPELISKLKGANNQTVNVNQTNNTMVVGEVFSDIEKIERSVGLILNDTNSKTNSSVREDSNEESLDDKESNTPKEEPKTDRLSDDE